MIINIFIILVKESRLFQIPHEFLFLSEKQNNRKPPHISDMTRGNMCSPLSGAAFTQEGWRFSGQLVWTSLCSRCSHMHCTAGDFLQEMKSLSWKHKRDTKENSPRRNTAQSLRRRSYSASGKRFQKGEREKKMFTACIYTHLSVKVLNQSTEWYL